MFVYQNSEEDTTMRKSNLIIRQKGFRIMKKKIMATLLAGVMVLAVGCSSKSGSGNVTLGEYKGLTLTSVSQATVDEEINTILKSYAELVTVDRAAVEGDTVNINFVGTLDGVAFEGGTNDSEEGANLELGSNSFIDGFEDGLIGAVAGEERVLNLTFPDPYELNKEMSGKDVVFTVTVNSVQELVVPELTDEFIAENAEGYANVEEYVEGLRDALNESSYFEQITELIMASSEVTEYPEDEVAAEKQAMIDYYNSYAEYYASYFGFDTETALAYFFNIESTEALETYAEEYAYQITKNKMILQEIAAIEEIQVTEADYNTQGLEYAISYGYEDLATFETDYGKEEIESVILLDMVMDFILEQAVIVDAE